MIKNPVLYQTMKNRHHHLFRGRDCLDRDCELKSDSEAPGSVVYWKLIAGMSYFKGVSAKSLAKFRNFTQGG